MTPETQFFLLIAGAVIIGELAWSTIKVITKVVFLYLIDVID